MSRFTSTILVTGGTTGLGYWAAYELAKQSPTSRIIISSRSDRDNAVQSLNNLLAKHSNNKANSGGEPQVEFLPLDLTSTQNVRTFVQNLSAKSYPPISSLLLNAGIQFHQGNSIRKSEEGVELTFATNHVGHALLFFLLRPHLSNDARIVITASGTHDPIEMAKGRLPFPSAEYTSAELLAHPTDQEGYENQKGVQRYASSKLANIIFMYALERRLQQLRKTTNKQWTVLAFDPGLMPGTSLGRDTGVVINWIFLHVAPYLKWLLRFVLRSDNVHDPEESGMNLAERGMTTGEQALAESGLYWEGAKVKESSVTSHDLDKQEDLWQWTVKFLGKDEKERKEFDTFQ